MDKLERTYLVRITQTRMCTVFADGQDAREAERNALAYADCGDGPVTVLHDWTNTQSEVLDRWDPEWTD